MRAASVVALGAALCLLACGGAQHPDPPRSTCADAAAGIARALRALVPSDAARVAALEPRFADTCRAQKWRAGVVRCFALARDPDEHRVCARRLDPAQRDEARLIQAGLYGSERPSRPSSLIEQSCRRLGPVQEALFTCDRLLPQQFDIQRAIEQVLGSAARAVASRDGDLIDQAAADCDRVFDAVRSLLLEAGC